VINVGFDRVTLRVVENLRDEIGNSFRQRTRLRRVRCNAVRSAVATLQTLFHEGQQRWPFIAISLAQWERGLEIVGISAATEPRSIELFLTVACSCGDAAAITTLEREYLASIFGALAKRFQLDPAAAADAVQRLREKLLVHRPDRAAAIVDYQGAGALGVWLHVVTLRELISQHRQLQRQRTNDGDDGVLEGLAGGDNPALELISKDSHAHVKAAYQAALARLAVRQRLILRMHICDRLSLEAIAATYNVNRVTVARWLDRARCDVAQGVRDQLLQTLHLAPGDVESLLRNVHSQFELSVERLL